MDFSAHRNHNNSFPLSTVFTKTYHLFHITIISPCLGNSLFAFAMAPPGKVTLQELGKKEKTSILDDFLTIPCIRCGNESHSCLDCWDIAHNLKNGSYGSLGQGKKMDADKYIIELKEKYQKNPEDPSFTKALTNERAKSTAVTETWTEGKISATTQNDDATKSGNTHAGSVAKSASPNENTTLPALAPKDTAGGTYNQHEAHKDLSSYPEVLREAMERNQPASVPAPTSRDLSRPSNTITSSTLKDMDKNELEFPKREMFANARSHVFTNHFEVELPEDLQLHKYTIFSNFSGLNKRKIRDIVKSMIAASPYLAPKQANFATDYYGTIVAWTNLHKDIPLKFAEPPTGTATSANTWRIVSLQDGPTPRHILLRYEGLVDLPGLLKYSASDSRHASDNLEPTKAALNILISKCFEQSTSNTFKVGSKYYLKNSYRALGTCRSLETSRGFDYQFKAGVGKIVLNLQTRTSASFKPVLLRQLMTDNQSFNTGNRNEMRAILTGLWVRIQYQRGDPNKPESYARLNSEQGRVKKIVDLGSSLQTQTFSMNGKNVTVHDYIRDCKS